MCCLLCFQYVILFIYDVIYLQDRSRCYFQQGDACDLPVDLGKFGCVLAANLICRLHTPLDFLNRLADLVIPGGIVVITSPYTFLEEFTPKVNILYCK